MTNRPISDEPNREQLLRMAIRTAKSGNRPAARVMFRQVLDEDKRNERAMMWMAKLAPNLTERKQWLTRAVAANPDNKQARDALNKLTYSTTANDNRMLLIFGGLAAVLLLLTVLVVALLFFLPNL